MDKKALQIRFRKKLGRGPSNPPVTFNDKIHWRKLNDRRPLLTEMTDKDVAKGLCGMPVIPTIATGFNPPNFPFIAKTNHWSGSTRLVENGNQWNALKPYYKQLLSRKYGTEKGEWAYWNIKPKLMIEPVCTGLHEIKLFCFHGKVELIRYMPPRNNFNQHPPERLGEAYLLPSGERLDIKISRNKVYEGEIPDIPSIIAGVKIPDIDHVRMDLYYNGSLYFGEYTLYSGSGMNLWADSETDKWLGGFWNVN